MMTSADIVEHFERLKGALQTGHRRDVVVICKAFISQNASIGGRWQTIATLLFYSGELQLALAAMHNFVSVSQNSPESLFEEAALMARVGELEQSYVRLNSLPVGKIDPASSAFLRGTVAMNIGKFNEAKLAFDETLKANPLLGQALLQLSLIDDLGTESPTGNRICSAQPSMINAHPIDQLQYQYALGRVESSRGHFADAFAAFSKGATIGSSLRPYDAASDSANAKASHAGYTDAIINSISKTISIDTSRPIFVTGLARSGTTLVEHIIASHSCVVGGEELNKMSLVTKDVGGSDAASLSAFGNVEGFDSIAESYLYLASQRFGENGRFVDKTLDASRFMGLIASVLPQATIIWVRRDPLDCAWSAFRTYFAAGLEWSWRLEDIAHHFKLEDMLFAHWTQLLGPRVLEVRYESLVANPHDEISKLLAHCNLPHELAPFNPHLTQRPVATASAMQVRRPISQTARGSSEPYTAYLQPFIDAYF